MVEIIWTEPALSDLDAIADYIALDKPLAAAAFARRVFAQVELLGQFPERGARPQELGRKSRYRHLVEPPCRIFYRYDGTRIFIIHVMRSERLLQEAALLERDEKA